MSEKVKLCAPSVHCETAQEAPVGVVSPIDHHAVERRTPERTAEAVGSTRRIVALLVNKTKDNIPLVPDRDFVAVSKPQMYRLQQHLRVLLGVVSSPYSGYAADVSIGGAKHRRRVYLAARHALRCAVEDVVESGATAGPLPPSARRVVEALRNKMYSDEDLAAITAALLPDEAPCAQPKDGKTIGQRLADAISAAVDKNALDSLTGAAGTPAPERTFSQTQGHVKSVKTEDIGEMLREVKASLISVFGEVNGYVLAEAISDCVPTPVANRRIHDVLKEMVALDKRPISLLIYRRNDSGGSDVVAARLDVKIGEPGWFDTARLLSSIFHVILRASNLRFDSALVRLGNEQPNTKEVKESGRVESMLGGAYEVLTSTQVARATEDHVVDFSAGALRSDR